MASNHNLSRRTMLRLGVGGAAAVALAPMGPVSAFAAPKAGNGSGRLIPAAKVGTITYTQRDVPGRLGIATGRPTLGHLGGANFPADPTDLGPLVPFPVGGRSSSSTSPGSASSRSSLPATGSMRTTPVEPRAMSTATSAGPATSPTRIGSARCSTTTGSR